MKFEKNAAAFVKMYICTLKNAYKISWLFKYMYNQSNNDPVKKCYTTELNLLG